jgi:hypothetical protein
VMSAVRERLGVGPEAGLRWATAAEGPRFGAQRELAEEGLAALGGVPELADALGCLLDLSGERLFALAPVLPRIRG